MTNAGNNVIDTSIGALSYVTHRLKYHTTRGVFEAYRRFQGIPQQRPLIHEFVENDDFLLVILDACRFDIFHDHIGSHLEGKIQNVWASGRWTAEYTQRTWTRDDDLTYLSSMPVVSDFYFDLREMDYRPTEHIRRLIPLWETDWNAACGTVPPERVTDAALAHVSEPDATRVVAHYSQPHAPYIGATEILPWDENPDEMRSLLKNDIDRPTQRIYRRIQQEEISEAKLRQAYRDNLERVLEEVVRLVRRVDCPVVITGDHGEHLGERGRYLHEEDSLLIRQVPWFVIDDDETGKESIEKDYEVRSKPRRDSPSEAVTKKLADLGYT
ncbi:hypothetical protein [Haloferax sp. ATB1]|uniref:hypothetical protein n=1 Tax=Haloferax sp. ATB1 TaxID=1508454 RepID=UPI0005B1E11D|nr:hypothetical protein [Haloferax sp. ATB1]